MPLYRNIVFALSATLLTSLPLFAAPHALIVVGTTGSSSITNELGGAVDNIRSGLTARGFASDAIEVLGRDPADGKVTRDLVLESLKKQQTLSSQDEFWLILLGFSGRTDEGAPAFQVSGPRLSADDLKSVLDAIPAKQFVFVGTSDSGSFVPLLLTKNRTVLAATREEGEIDLPRFPEAWAETLKEQPKASWKALAAQAAILNDKTYAESNLAVGEHARLGDSDTGRVLEAPFGVDAEAQPEEKPQVDGSMALVSASDIKVEIHKPNSEWEKQPATAETKKMIEAARAVPNPDGYNAVFIQQKLSYRVDEDRTAEDYVLQRVYIEREDGVTRWANFLLPQDPPAVTTKLEAARIIQPDGSSTVFNPAKMPAATDDSSGLSGALTMVFMPDAHAGCLIEIAYRSRHILDASVPEFSEELPVQQDIPALETEVQLQTAPELKVHFKLRNSDVQPVETTVNSQRVLTWTLKNTPAFEPLPYDPPERDLVVALDISSLDSWDSFASWYMRLARGSDTQDATVKAKAEELASGTTGRMDKIRKAYEFVAALRYVAIEFGINGIRPRTPAIVLQNRYGDCKDKANLLIALLGDMGVDAQFSVLNRGSSTDVSFPSWQFNHAIAFVPKASESGQPNDLWLDTTDSTAPFPTLSPGDIGRSALVFDKNAAKFITVTSQKEEMTSVEEHWKWAVVSTGAKSWTGQLQETWTGLADYDLRSAVRGLSPRQRDFVLQTELAKQLPNADFTQFILTPADDLSKPMQLQAGIATVYPPRPAPGAEIESYFVAPERNRPLLMNNGQKLHLLQTLDITDSTAPDFQSPLDLQAAGVHATIKWENAGNSTWRRTAELTVDQPLVAQADYKSVRGVLQAWLGQLTH
jgi:hypothetical protein